MAQETGNPARGQAAGFGDVSSSAVDPSSIGPNAKVAQVKIDMLVDDIVDTAGWLVSQLSVLPSQRAAGDVAGMIYTLRRCRAYWKSISGSALELATANDDRLSALRQEEQSR
jgi:hypothetical protein